MNSAVLDVLGLSVWFGARPILNDVTISVPARGITTIMGPGGAGKSTLLRTICGLNDHIPLMRRDGEISFGGSPLGSADLPRLVEQRLDPSFPTSMAWLLDALPQRSALAPLAQRSLLCEHLERLGFSWLEGRLDAALTSLTLLELRAFGIARASLSPAPLLCIDEPMHSLEDDEAEILSSAMLRLADAFAILLVTHHQRRARALSTRVVLLARGQVWEDAPVRAFFDEPRDAIVRQFLRTGSCDAPAPHASGTAAPEPEPPTPEPVEGVTGPAVSLAWETRRLDREAIAARYDVPTLFARASVGPRGFHWFAPGRLGGAQKPGLLTDLDLDLGALKRVGVTHLITLTESPHEGIERFSALGIGSSFFPIDDMHAPELEAAAALCADIDRLLEAGECVVVHCKAGLGRTGTVLCAHGIWLGLSAEFALPMARRIEPKWVQSELQESFLGAFEEFCRARVASGAHDAHELSTLQTKARP